MQFGIAEAVAHWAQYRPRTVAVYCNGRPVTFAELDRRAMAIASQVLPREQDIRSLQAPGELPRIALLIRAKLDFLAGLLGVLQRGYSVVVLNPALPIEALRVNVADTLPCALLADAQTHGLGTQLVGTEITLVQGWDGLHDTSSKASTVRERGPSDEWGVLFSSGSTGAPKGIERSHDSMTTELVGWCLELALSRHTRFYVGRPLFYTGGLVVSLATLLVGGAVVLDDYSDDNDPMAIWSAYQAALAMAPVECAFFTPDLLRELCRLAETTKSLRSAEIVLVMGGPISGAEKRSAASQLRSGVVESWGNSESLGTITDPEDLDIRPDSVGRPFLTDRMCIVDKDGAPVLPGTRGRIAGGEEGGFSKYANRPAATSLVKQGSLIISEDIGHRDPTGYFYIDGRVQEGIPWNEDVLFLPKLEEQLRTSDVITECCIVPLPAPTAVTLVALVVARNPAELKEEALLSDLNGALGGAVVLHRVVLVSRLPRLAAGKIDRAAAKHHVENCEH